MSMLGGSRASVRRASEELEKLAATSSQQKTSCQGASGHASSAKLEMWRVEMRVGAFDATRCFDASSRER